MKYKEQHNNENPSESIGVRIKHYFTGEPSQYQYDYVPTTADTYTSILQYYRDQYNIPRPKELPPLYAHNNNNNNNKASNKLLSDLSSHSRSDYNEDQISLIKRAYGNRAAEIPACFRSSSRSKYSVSASHSERGSSEDDEEEDDNESENNTKHNDEDSSRNSNKNNDGEEEEDDDGMSLIQIHRKSSHSSSTISAPLHRAYYKNSVEKTCWVNVNPVVVKPFSQVNNENENDK